MANKPHCYGKMFWILDQDFSIEKPQHLCDCNHGYTCLELTRKKATTLNNEIKNLKVNGKLDVFNPKLKELFYKDVVFYKICCTCKKEHPTSFFEEYSNECSFCVSNR